MKSHSAKIGSRFLFISFFLLAALKILLVGFDIDEQYAVTMSFRLLKGDFPVLDMWEPHQTSGFLCALLMAPYLALTKTSAGIFLYLRICGIIIHFGLFFMLRRFLCQILEPACENNMEGKKICATFIACIFFFTLPKLMFLPEFSNLQVWFLMFAIIFLVKYYTTIFSKRNSSKIIYLILAGICIMLEVLSYPSTIFVFIFCTYYIIHIHRQQGLVQTLKELAAFVFPCILGFLIFSGYLLSYMSISQLFELLPIVASDGSHSASYLEKLVSNAGSLGVLFMFAVIYGAVTTIIFLLVKKRRALSNPPGFLCWVIYFLIVTLLGQLIIWIAGNRYPNYPHAEYFFLPLLILIWRRYQKTASGPLFAFAFVVPFIAFGSILLFTNHPLIVSTPFLGSCAAGSLLLLSRHILTDREPGCLRLQKLLHLLLGLWVGVLLFGNLLLIRTTGGVHYTVFDPVSLIRHGPAVGIIADTETVKKYNAAASLLAENIPDGANVFYAGTSSAIYLQGDIHICTPTTISSPTFDEKISYYFELHPEKTPEYIICDNNLLYLSENIWLADYINASCEEIPTAGNDFFIVYKSLSSH